MKYLKKYNEQININDYLKDGGKTLWLNSLGLTQLPELPKSLEELYCYNNKLTQLPELPEGLRSLCCNNNKLTKLPELPKGLKGLWCYDNNLTQLPELPEGLRYLYCWNNNLPYKNLKGYWEWFWKENPELKAAKDLGLW
jgi:Leucine-rich repeat (LRR) protein